MTGGCLLLLSSLVISFVFIVFVYLRFMSLWKEFMSFLVNSYGCSIGFVAG